MHRLCPPGCRGSVLEPRVPILQAQQGCSLLRAGVSSFASSSPPGACARWLRGAGKDALYISEIPSPVLLLQSRVPLGMCTGTCSQPVLLLLGGLQLLAVVWGHSNARGLLGLQQQLVRPRLAEWGFFSPFNKREPVHSTGVIVLGLSCEERGCRSNISCLGAEQGSWLLGCLSCCSCC